MTSKVSLNIKGKNINRFIKKLAVKKIEILSLKYQNENEVDIIIYKKDLEKVFKIKSIYNISKTGYFGLIKIKRKIILNKHIIIALITSFLIFQILTNMIFKIEVIHSNKEIRNLIKNELEKEGLKKYAFKKSYKEIENVKKHIISKYQNKIEWLEIETHGTKLTVRVEERKINENKEGKIPRNRIAKKTGVIKKVIAEEGEIVKDMDDYVSKGDVIISGELVFSGEIKGKVKAEGKVYAETWYITKTKYPVINEEVETGKHQKKYVLKFLNKEIELNKYKNKKYKEKVLLSHPLLPIKLVYQNQTEIKKTSEILTYDQILAKAQKASEEKIKKNLKNGEYIIRSKYLKSQMLEKEIEVEMFYSIYEDITDYQDLPE